MAVFTATYSIHTYEVDVAGRATFGSIFRFLQDSAAEHATRIGYGLDDMRANSSLWVLSRLRYRGRRTPRWQESLRIETWPSGTESLFALREWLVTDEGGGEVARATSSWVVIDIEKRRPIRIERVAERMDMLVDRRLFDRTAGKVPALESASPRSPDEPRRGGSPPPGSPPPAGSPARAGAASSYDLRATFTDMDLNGHVNAARYVEWMFDGLPVGFRESGSELVEIEVNFSGESHAGEALSVRTLETSEEGEEGGPDTVGFFHEVTNPRHGTVLCRARSRWRPAD